MELGSVITAPRQIAARYNEFALEHLSKADEVEPQATECGPHATDQDDGSDMDRDQAAWGLTRSACGRSVARGCRTSSSRFWTV